MKFRLPIAALLTCGIAIAGSSCESMQAMFAKKDPPQQVPDPYAQGYGATNTAANPYGYQAEQQPAAGYGQPAYPQTAPQQGYGGYTPPQGGSGGYDTGGSSYSGSTGSGYSGSSGGGRTYTVAKGDNLYRIARKHNASVDSIMRANNLSNPDRIQAGQRLTIP